MRKAVIDIGTNSVRLLVADKREDGSWEKVYTDLLLCRLGENVGEEQIIKEEPLRRTMDGVVLLQKKARELQCEKVLITATSAIREAKNKKEVCDKFKGACGQEIVVLSGEEEAQASYCGAKGRDEHVAVLDIGGGSTELVLEKDGRLLAKSVPIGAVRMLEREDLRQNYREILEEFLPLCEDERVLVGVGGTATTLAAMDMEMEVYDAQKVQGYEIDKERVDFWVRRLGKMPLEERKKLKGLQEKRADVIEYGLKIMQAIMEMMQAQKIKISDRDLLYALLDW